MVESPGVSRYFKNKNTEKEVHQFHEDYSTKRGEKTTENQDGDAWEGVNRACRTLAGTAFMGKLLFRQRVQEAVRKERGGKCTVSDGWWCANGSRGIDSGSDLDGAGSEGVVG